MFPKRKRLGGASSESIGGHVSTTPTTPRVITARARDISAYSTGIPGPSNQRTGDPDFIMLGASRTQRDSTLLQFLKVSRNSSTNSAEGNSAPSTGNPGPSNQSTDDPDLSGTNRAQRAPTLLQLNTAQRAPTLQQLNTAQRAPTLLQLNTAQRAPTPLRLNTTQRAPTLQQLNTAQRVPTLLQLNMAQRTPTSLQLNTAQRPPTLLQLRTVSRNSGTNPAEENSTNRRVEFLQNADDQVRQSRMQRTHKFMVNRFGAMAQPQNQGQNEASEMNRTNPVATAQPSTSQNQNRSFARIMDMVHISGIPPHVTREQIYAVFGIDVILRIHTTGADAYIKYESAQSAGVACAWFDNSVQWGSTLRVQLTETSRLSSPLQVAMRQIELGESRQVEKAQNQVRGFLAKMQKRSRRAPDEAVKREETRSTQQNTGQSRRHQTVEHGSLPIHVSPDQQNISSHQASTSQQQGSQEWRCLSCGNTGNAFEICGGCGTDFTPDLTSHAQDVDASLNQDQDSSQTNRQGCSETATSTNADTRQDADGNATPDHTRAGPSNDSQSNQADTQNQINDDQSVGTSGMSTSNQPVRSPTDSSLLGTSIDDSMELDDDILDQSDDILD